MSCLFLCECTYMCTRLLEYCSYSQCHVCMQLSVGKPSYMYAFQSAMSVWICVCVCVCRGSGAAAAHRLLVRRNTLWGHGLSSLHQCSVWCLAVNTQITRCSPLLNLTLAASDIGLFVSWTRTRIAALVDSLAPTLLE